jgi:small subunit ribosomal protein S13
MPRIAGVDIPEKKKVRYSLRYIYGIGPKFADDIIAEAKINPDTHAADLTDEEVSTISALIDTGYIVEGALRRQVQQNIQRLAASVPAATPVPARDARRPSPARRA